MFKLPFKHATQVAKPKQARTINHEAPSFGSTPSIHEDLFFLELANDPSSLLMKETQESLETSASYMDEIESFFHELSSAANNSSSSNTSSGTDSTSSTSYCGDGLISNISSRSLTSLTFPGNTCTVSPLLSGSPFDLDSFGINPSGGIGGFGGAIDPAIFNNFRDQDGCSDGNDTDNTSCFYNNNNIFYDNYDDGCNYGDDASLDKRNYSSSSSSRSTSSSSSFKAPKFYSRSGQVADPNRGPCHNCHTTLTCYWRKLKGQYHCNACTLFYKRNKYHRSGDASDKPIKRRNRKSKYSQI